MSIYKVLHNKRKVDLSCSLTAGQQVAIITLSDITRVKKYEKQKQSLRFQQIYFHSMAHDVRTPMNAIMSANENLKNELVDP